MKRNKMDEATKHSANLLIDRINSLWDANDKTRKEAHETSDESQALIMYGLANGHRQHALGIVEAIYALVGCEPTLDTKTSRYLHF